MRWVGATIFHFYAQSGCGGHGLEYAAQIWACLAVGVVSRFRLVPSAYIIIIIIVIVVIDINYPEHSLQTIQKYHHTYMPVYVQVQGLHC